VGTDRTGAVQGRKMMARKLWYEYPVEKTPPLTRKRFEEMWDAIAKQHPYWPHQHFVSMTFFNDPIIRYVACIDCGALLDKQTGREVSWPGAETTA
jgi:hypothetical protein